MILCVNHAGHCWERSCRRNLCDADRTCKINKTWCTYCCLNQPISKQISTLRELSMRWPFTWPLLFPIHSLNTNALNKSVIPVWVAYLNFSGALCKFLLRNALIYLLMNLTHWWISISPDAHASFNCTSTGHLSSKLLFLMKEQLNKLPNQLEWSTPFPS